MLKLKWMLLLLGLAISSVLPVRAQEEVQIGTLEIALWPEYDKPEVLVIYRLFLSDDSLLPAQLSLRIPATAGRPHAVAVREPSGQLVNLEYELTSDGTWSTITMVANFPELQLEYYNPGLLQEGSQRTFSFEWIGDYAVNQCSVEIQQPLGASDMTILPGPVTSSSTASDGLVYYTKEVGALLKGQVFKLELAYQKNDDNLSVSGLQVQPSAPLSTASEWQDKMLGILPWVLSILGVLLIAGGVVWYWQSGRQSQPSKTQRGRARRSASPDSEAFVALGPVYCHQCGKRAADGDRFCRSCGTRLRVE